MGFKYADIPENPSESDIKKEIERLKQLKTDFKNKNEALKIILNSIYGVAGFTNFICYNRDVAESVTLQSQDLIQYTIKIYNEYFREIWHTDRELHQKMGIMKAPRVKYDVINYADTDSVFAVLKGVYESTDFKGDFIDFVIKLTEGGLKDWVDKKLVEYIDKYNGFQTKKNGNKSLNLDMEQVCKSVLWVAKKKYIKDPIYFDGMRYEPLSKIQVKGLELNQSSTPKFIRDKLKDIVEFILSSGANINRKELLRKLHGIKGEFHTVPLEFISKIERVTNYEKWIINDSTKLEFLEGAKPHVKGAGYYNHLLKHSEFKNKYEFIKSGTKVHWYYCTSGAIESFAFLTGNLPEEIRPPLNLNKQYEKVFLGPLNNILKAIDIPAMTHALTLYPAFTPEAIKPE